MSESKPSKPQGAPAPAPEARDDPSLGVRGTETGKAEATPESPVASTTRAPGEGEPPPSSPKKSKATTPAVGFRAEPARPAPAPRPVSGGVKAGFADDNLQFNAFLGFLDKNGHLALKSDVTHRSIVTVRDRDGLPLADAEVSISDGGRELLKRRTYADGRALIFASESPSLQSQSTSITVRYQGQSQTALLSAAKRHSVDLRLPLRRPAFQRVPLDLAFVLDTTGSMGDEIEHLKKTLEYINFQISNLTPAPDVRFGMVLYRDRGDAYVTQVVPFTTDLKQFRWQLGQVTAGGGGDTPEDVQEGLHQAMTGLKWRPEGAKLAFLIGDAPPHLDYGQTYTYLQAMRDAAAKAIKITTIGCSGLDVKGELVWRQLAQYTMAPYVFLTRGEKGDSEGSFSTVSHHVGSNWVAENLDAIVIRMVKVELAHYSPKGTQPLEDYFSASYNDKVKSDDVMTDLFHQAVGQLIDYSVQRIQSRTPTVILPPKTATAKLLPLAKQLETRLAVALGHTQEFQLLESRDLSEVIRTQSSQLSEKFDADKAVKLGRLLPAKLAILSKIEESGGRQVEMLIKLVRLETGEILSLSLLKIDRNLLAAGK
jgi:hypothetical protein